MQREAERETNPHETNPWPKWCGPRVLASIVPWASRRRYHRGEHLGAVQQQSVRSTTLLVQMQQQMLGLQKRLSTQQRRTVRLQELQHTSDAAAKSWSVERVRLGQVAARAEERARIAEERPPHDGRPPLAAHFLLTTSHALRVFHTSSRLRSAALLTFYSSLLGPRSSLSTTRSRLPMLRAPTPRSAAVNWRRRARPSRPRQRRRGKQVPKPFAEGRPHADRRRRRFRRSSMLCASSSATSGTAQRRLQDCLRGRSLQDRPWPCDAL